MLVRLTRMMSMASTQLLPLTKARLVSKRLSNQEFTQQIGNRVVTGGFLPNEVEFFSSMLAGGRIDRETLIWSFFRLPDRMIPERVRLNIIAAHHDARVELVTKVLPAAKRIIDLGGASDLAVQGALLSMGYPHRPDSLSIVDRPPERRTDYNPQIEQRNTLEHNGTRINYVDADLSDLSSFADRSIDMVWSGQSIEHVSTEIGKKTIASCHRVLAKDGRLCLDTPNGRVARLASPHALLHPEHQIEYVPSHLISLIENEGFRVVKALAISPLPISARIGRLSRAEMIENRGLGADPTNGFSFYLEAVKAE